MGTHNRHFRIISQAAFAGVLALCICGGCWEEIEYSGPIPSAAPQRDATSAAVENPTGETAADPTQTALPSAPNDSTASQFADELADASVDNAPSDSPAATTAPADDRYEIPNDDDDQSELGAQAVSATLDTPTTAPPANTRRAAWLLGSRLSLAALAHDRGVAADEVPTWFQEARSAAESIQTSLTELPERPASSDSEPVSREVLGYLLEQGRQVSPGLAKQFGPDHAALFEVAMKSNLLLVLYKPDSSAVEHISAAIANAAPRAGLPPELWRPLLDTLANGAPAVEVRTAVRRLHADVDQHLATAVEP
jgi:hypothetical protein